MPTFLSDPTQGFYLALVTFAVVSGAVFARNQSKKSGAVFGVALLLLLAVYLCDAAGESPREQAVRRATAMAAAANDKNPDAFVEHIAETFDYTGEQNTVKKNRSDIRASSLWPLLRQYNVRVSAWAFDRAEVKEIDENSVEIGFMAKGEAEGKPVMFYLRATFKKQADGQMKLTALRSFHPANHTERVSIPGF